MSFCVFRQVAMPMCFRPLNIFTLITLLAFMVPGTGFALGQRVALKGHVPRGMMADAQYVAPMDSGEHLDLVVALPLRHKEELEQLIEHLHDPAHPLYGKYLSPEAFAERFGPSPEDVEVVEAHFRAAGYETGKTPSNRMFLKVRGRVDTVQQSMKTRLNHYRRAGRNFHAPSVEPSLPKEIASRILSISGLQSSRVMEPQIMRNRKRLPSSQLSGSGPGGGLSPQNIQTAYGLPGGATNGQGQTLALFEMDGYRASDIQAYTNYFALRQVPLENVLVGGFNGQPGININEVELDIELMNAVAPGASKILVYEGPNTQSGTIEILNKMATDNRASVISISWGSPEIQISQGSAEMESQIFQQMAAQGQTVLVASGDKGAYDADPPRSDSQLTVVDPASQPYVTGTGGTTLTLSNGQYYGSEVTWNQDGGASGGGVSIYWSIPPWQIKVPTLASKTARNVPDVALDSNPNTGYSTFIKGKWTVIGGTSAAAPIWGGFVALVNQSRIQKGEAVIGFMNPILYSIGLGSSYSANFHDISLGNNNYYSAGIGYDNTTGWGSFQGANLLASLLQTSQSIAFVNAPKSIEWGKTVNIKGAAVASSGLPVTYEAGPSTNCALKDTFLTGTLPGTCVLNAIQPGNDTYAAASATTSIAVVKPVYPGINRTLSVQVLSLGGTVSSSPVGIECGDGMEFCTQAFTRNTMVTLNARSYTGHPFVRWSGACNGKAPICRVRMSANRQVKALFQ